LTVDSELAPESDPARSVGRMLAGRYRLLNVLGEGGMATVYEAEHVALGKRVAIKLVQSLLARDDEIVHRFEREARNASAVESEHIVHVFDVGADPDLGLFLVMELLKGEDLARVLAQRGQLEPRFACALVKQASLGLEKAHAAGIIHRDLKPANVFLVERDDGTTLVKLVDFGIAKMVREAQGARFLRQGITRRGTAIGTPQYMSPEQAQALDTVDHRTDVFSLGAVLFEAIAGKPYLPERPTYEQTILQLVSTRAPRLSSAVPDIPPELDELVADMLEHDVDLRVKDMRTVRKRIEGIYPDLAGSAVKLKSLPPPSSRTLHRYLAPESGPRFSPTVSAGDTAMALPRTRRPLLYVAALAVAIGAVIGIAVLGSARKSQRAPPLVVTSTSTALAVAPPAVSVDVPASATARAPDAAPTHRPPSGATTERPGLARHVAPRRDQVGAAGISSQF
jgi:serine/threonine protein kinase